MADTLPVVLGTYSAHTTNVAQSDGSTPARLTGLSLTLTDAVDAGDAVVVLVGADGAPSGITDGHGNTYVRVSPPTSNGPTVWVAQNVTALPALTTLRIAALANGIAAIALRVHGLTSATLLDAATLAQVQTTGGPLLDLDSGPVTVSQPNVLLLAAATWPTGSGPDGGPTDPAAVTFGWSVAGGYTPSGPEVWASHVHYFYLGNEDPPQVHDFWSNASGYLLGGARALDAASGSYHAILQFVSGSPTGAPARGVALVALRGLRNRAPLAPALAQTGGFDATAAIPLSWTFSDPDQGDTQSAYQLIVSLAGSPVYDSGKAASSVAAAVVPAGTLANGNSYQWTVRTWDASDLVGPYAATASFTTAPGPLALVTSPSPEGVTLTGPDLTVTWQYTSGGGGTQTAYLVRVLAGAVVKYTSGKALSGATTLSVPLALADHTAYSVEVTVWDTNGVPSVPATRGFRTAFLMPPAPSLTATPLGALGCILLKVSTPAASGSQSPPVSVDLYRRDLGIHDWTHIATGLNPTASFQDFGAVDEVTHQYQARTTAVSTGTAYSGVVAAELVIEGVFLHAASAPAATAHHFLFDNGARSDTITPALVLVQYDGRSDPVAQFDATAGLETVSCDLTLPWDLGGKKSSDRVALEALTRRREVLCYRDHRSRKLYGVLARGISFDDALLAYHTRIDLTKVAFDETLEGLGSPVPQSGVQQATAVPTSLGVMLACTGVLLQADPDNGATVYVGTSVAQTIALAPGQAQYLAVGSVADVYVYAPLDGPVVNWIATPEVP